MEMIINKIYDKATDAGGIIINCIIVIILCALLYKVTSKLIISIFNSKIASGKVMTERKVNTISPIVLSAVKYIYYFIAIFSVLTMCGIDSTSLLAVAGVGSVAIGFGAQSLVKDVISGFFILMEDQYGVGDIIEIQGINGTVEEMSIRTTKIRGFDGTVHFIPNGAVVIVTNMCKDYINAIVDIDIDYNEDMDKVLEILNDEIDIAYEKIEGFRKRPDVLGITGLNDSAVRVRIVAECEIKSNYNAERELRRILKKRLDDENISIPFPQRTIHIADKKEV